MEFSTTLTTSYLANGVSAALTTPSARLPYKATFDSVSPLLPRAAHAASHQSAKAHLHDSFHVSDWISRTRRNTIDEFTSRSQSGLASLATPRASNTPQTVKPETTALSVDADGTYFLNQNTVSDSKLIEQLKTTAAQNPQLDLHIRGHKAVRYERVAPAMAAAQQAGVKKIGFITEPKH